jgi:IDEAL domain
MRMKSFKQFMNEADIKGNPAISPEYLTSLDKRAEASARDIEQRFGREMGSLMRFVMEVQSMQRGKEKQLEDLTRSVIEEQYGSILGETELDIRIPTDPREMKQQMDQEQPEEQETPSFKEIEDEDTKTAIHKRKIQNMIAQGEAINSKKMLMGDTNMAGLTELFGEEKARRMVELLVKITDICNARDWRIPEEVGAAMIEQGNGLSGISKIEWKPKEEKEADETPKEDDMSPEEDHQSDTAKLIILGMDQAMLLHEAVKAIYGLINQGGLAHLDDETIAKVFMNADTARDEVQDLKRAKLTAADLRDFINTFPEVADIENGREYVWGKMIDASIIPDIKFLELMRLIFTAAPLYRQVSENEPPYTEEETSAANEAMPKAKAIVQKLIQLIQDELAEWEDSVSGSGYDDEEYGDSSFDTAFDNDFEPRVARGELSQSEIRDLIDQALDSGDSEEFKRLSKLLKENN